VFWLGFSPSSGDCCVKSVNGTARAQTGSERLPSIFGGRGVRVATATCVGDTEAGDCTGSASTIARSTGVRITLPLTPIPTYRTWSRIAALGNSASKLSPAGTTARVVRPRNMPDGFSAGNLRRQLAWQPALGTSGVPWDSSRTVIRNGGPSRFYKPRRDDLTVIRSHSGGEAIGRNTNSTNRHPAGGSLRPPPENPYATGDST